MTITQTGATTEIVDADGISGRAYAVGYNDADPGTADVGEWSVAGGDLNDLTIADLSPTRPQSLIVGLGEDASGLVSVSGLLTVLHFGNGGLDDTASGLGIGLAGAAGRLELQSTTTFEIIDASTAAVDAAHGLDDQEFVTIGSGAGSLGELWAQSAAFAVEGNSVALRIGSDGGVGTALFTNNARFKASAHGAGSASELLLVVGDGAGDGAMTFRGSQAIFQSADDSHARFVIGRDGGVGVLTLDDASTFTATGGDEGVNGTIGSGAGATGSLSLTNGAELTLQGGGRNGLDVGRAGGTGAFELASSSLLKVVGADAAYLVVGRDAGSYATGSIGQATLWVEATGAGSASADIGGMQGYGALSLAAGGLLHLQSAGGTSLNVGTEDGAGMLGIARGSSVEMSGAGVSVAVGASGGVGAATMDGGAWSLASTASAVINIGHSGVAGRSDSGFGSMTVQNGARIDFDVRTKSDLVVGGGEGSTALLMVRGGAVIDMNAAGDPGVVATLKIGTRGAADASVIIDGAAATILGLDYVGVGYSPDDSFGAPGGRGTLLVRNGAALSVGEVLTVGAGGTIGGLNGTINGDVRLDGGGRVDLRDGQAGLYTVNGDVFVDRAANALFVDVASGGANDRLVMHGFDTSAGGQLEINLNVLDGFRFAVDETRVVLSVTSAGSGGNRPTWTVDGQHADFAYYGGWLDSQPGRYVFKALNSGATGGAGVLDFGAGKPAATLAYDAAANHGVATGGQFTGAGGRAYNVDQFRGTDSGDTLTIVGAALRSFTLDGRGGVDVLTGGMGADILIGGDGNDTLNGGGGADVMQGGADNDTYAVNDAGDIADESVAGSGGTDLVQSSISFSLADAVHARGAIENLTLATGTAAINGAGNGLANVIVGNEGINVLDGGLGGDTLLGNGGNDVFLYASQAAFAGDAANGGAGIDRIRFTSVTANSTLTLSSKVALVEVAEISTAAGAATGTTALNLNALAVSAGMQLFGNNGNNIINGTNLADTITGNAGNDTLLGNGGIDILIGGAGRDTQTGGAGNDVFRFTARTDSPTAALADVITDFDRPGRGDDRIDVSALFGPAMAYRGAAAFTAAGQVRINDIAGPDLLVEVNTGGTLAPDLVIRLAGTTLASMAANDFIL